MESKLITKTIKVTSRASVSKRVGGKDQYYTVEYSEERVVPDGIEVDIEAEREMLWAVCNEEVDKQIEEIMNL